MKKTAKQRALHRLKIIHGHLNKIEQMVEEDRYCVDVITQSLAVQSSLKSLNKLLLEKHISTCVIDQVKQGNSKKIVDELIKLYELEARS
ncbi:metal-sensing transcriptional repressor [Candidatus Berkelbacteria bacterium]|nr:metal-sensing transcriptional repressor [Candidatus Berkelbacteria bacterium]